MQNYFRVFLLALSFEIMQNICRRLVNASFVTVETVVMKVTVEIVVMKVTVETVVMKVTVETVVMKLMLR